MTKTIAKLVLSGKLLLRLILIFSAMHCLSPQSVLSQATSGTTPTESAQTAIPSPAPVPEPPADLDFSMDTAEFEDFGQEDFVVEEPLDPKTETAVTAVKIIAGVVGLLIVFWLIRRLFSGSRSTKT
jgi:hypothetical protein